MHLLDGMGQIQGATTSATTYELSKTPITYEIPHREGVSNTPQTHPIRARTDPGLSQAELGRGTGRQRGSHGQRITWASVGHICPCLEGACGCYLCCMCDLSKNCSGNCPESVSGKCPRCPVSNWTFWTWQSMILSDHVRSCPGTCPVVSGECPVACPK